MRSIICACHIANAEEAVSEANLRALQTEQQKETEKTRTARFEYVFQENTFEFIWTQYALEKIPWILPYFNTICRSCHAHILLVIRSKWRWNKKRIFISNFDQKLVLLFILTTTMAMTTISIYWRMTIPCTHFKRMRFISSIGYLEMLVGLSQRRVPCDASCSNWTTFVRQSDFKWKHQQQQQ